MAAAVTLIAHPAAFCICDHVSLFAMIASSFSLSWIGL
jgi:hypothetical protein